MKTVDSGKAQWRRIGSSKARCVVVGTNNGQGGMGRAVVSDKVKPLRTYPQVVEYDDEVDDQQELPEDYYESLPRYETARDYMEVAASADLPDVRSITGYERDADVKDMDTSTISTTNQASNSKYAAVARTGSNRPKDEKPVSRSSDGPRRGRDLHGGMELLGIDFLLDMVENIDGTEEHDITMRKLSIHELMRTSRIGEVDSNVLKYYCLDSDGLYGREIQCEAMKELSRRTLKHTSS